jgi:hypothetical protein
MQELNKLGDTAIGKNFKVLLWVIGSYLVAWLGAWASKHSFTGAWVVVPGLVNFVAYSWSTFRDPTVPNTTSSTPMVVVPASTVVTPTVPPAV